MWVLPLSSGGSFSFCFIKLEDSIKKHNPEMQSDVRNLVYGAKMAILTMRFGL